MAVGSAACPFGQGLARTVAMLAHSPGDYGLAYMDVGEGREQGAEAFPAHAALQ